MANIKKYSYSHKFCFIYKLSFLPQYINNKTSNKPLPQNTLKLPKIFIIPIATFKNLNTNPSLSPLTKHKKPYSQKSSINNHQS